MKIDYGNFESNLLFLERTNLISTDKLILEVGSGTGHLLKTLKDKKYNIIGTEANDIFIKYAEDTFKVNLIKETTEKLNFESNSFDIVLSFDVLEHIPEIGTHIQEVYRVLKDDGVYILSTPNKWTNIPFEVIVNKSFTKYKEYHCSLQNYWQLKNLFRKYGFIIEFYDIPIVNKAFLEKVRKYFGICGKLVFKAIPMDKFPFFMRTNFYVVARKK